MIICLAQLKPLPLTVSCFSKIQIGFTFLVPVHPGSPGKRAVKRVCVCACLFIYFATTFFAFIGLQCFDAVGWAAGRAYGL